MNIKTYLRKFSPRAWSNDELRKLKNYFPKNSRIINVGGWEDKDKEGGFYKDYFPNPVIYHVANYPGDSKRGTNVRTDLTIDLTKSLPGDLYFKYDIALTHTVLEHVPDPVFSFAQIGKLSRDIIITVVPFKQHLHFEPESYGDYYRFSPFSMRKLHKDNDFNILYESYMPIPSLDVYLFYVGTRFSERYRNFPIKLNHILDLNEIVGKMPIYSLLQNIIQRFITKYLIKTQ